MLVRKPKDLNDDIVKDFMFEKVVLVTGAGGTIGSEICKQCLKFGVKRLIMLDHSEFNLYKINEITKSNKKNVLKLLSVINLKDIEDEVFKEFDIDIVIHAAAYKHVPLCEFNIKSAVKNNILGTKNMIDLSNKYNVKRFVLISTDKAVRPTSIMGTTKRICELYALNQNSKTEFVAVRFGNVLGSSGSVIPKFKEQIKNGENLTVTHPDIVRYFMLVSEACQLVLQAASIAKGDELFVLDMGKQVKIADLAKKMLELANRTDLKVVFTGLRPGEKLYEELLINENDKQTKFESIFVTKSQKYDLNLLNLQINELLNLDEKDMESKLCEIVPEFSHALNKKDWYLIIREIEEFKLTKSIIKAYLSYIFSQNLPNFSEDINEEKILKSCKDISDELMGYDTFYILDKNGYQVSDNLVFSAKGIKNTFKGEDKSTKSYYKKAVKEKRAYLCEPYPGTFDSKLKVTMAVPIYSQDKELLYVVCCDILLEDIL